MKKLMVFIVLTSKCYTEAVVYCNEECAWGKELSIPCCRTTSRGTLATFRYARTIYARSSPRIWHPFMVVQTYVKKAGVRMHNDGFRAVSDIRARRSSYNHFSRKRSYMTIFDLNSITTIQYY